MIDLGNVFILGDSYSTFKGSIPEGYSYWYATEITTDTDVCLKEETWWQQLIDETKSNLLFNNSYSGTTICKTGYGNKDCSDICFIGRLDKLIENGYFKENKVDTFLVFGGTNDNWVPSPIGELKYSDWTSEELFNFCPAVCYMLHRLKTNLPDTRIICILNCDLKKDITDNFKTACEKSGVEYVALQGISKRSGHPDKKGMTQIKEQIIEYLR